MIAIKEQMIQPPPLDSKGCCRCALSSLLPPTLHACPALVTITLLDASLSASVHVGRSCTEGRLSFRSELTHATVASFTIPALLPLGKLRLFFFFSSSATSQFSLASRSASGNPHNYPKIGQTTREQRTERDGVIKWKSVVTDAQNSLPGASSPT